MDAVKPNKSRMQDLEKGSPSANNDNDSDQESSKFVFTPKQERELAIYLENCSILKHGLNPNATRKLAYQWATTLKLKFPPSWELNEGAGFDWFKVSMKRNATLSLKKPENTSLACAAGFNATVIGAFFCNLQGLYSKFQFRPGRIWNYDETGVPTVFQGPKVIAKKGQNRWHRPCRQKVGKIPQCCALCLQLVRLFHQCLFFQESRLLRE